jgi:hypothetical protein
MQTEEALTGFQDYKILKIKKDTGIVTGQFVKKTLLFLLLLEIL